MPAKQGVLSRADLLSLITTDSNIQVEPEDLEFLADALGVRYQPQQMPKSGTGFLIEDHFNEQVAFEHVSKQVPDKTNQLSNPSPTAKLRAQYWQLLKQTNREDDTEQLAQKPIITRPKWCSRPTKRPAFPALMSEEAIRQRLIPALRQDKAMRSIDMDKLIDQVSRAEFVTELPRQYRHRDTQALQIIDDRQVHLMPYWLDHTWLTWHVRDAMAEYRFSQAVIEQGESQPQSIRQQTLVEYQAPPEGSTILWLSDLGVLTGRTPHYQALLEQFLSQGYHIVVVTPCHINDYPADMMVNVTLISWETSCRELPTPRAATTPEKSEPVNHETTTDQPPTCPRQQWAETLLMLCSTAVRLEPELLRSVRYALNEWRVTQGKRPIPASAESLAWQHPAVSQKHSVAATVDTIENRDWQLALKTQPDVLKQKVFGVQRDWRGGDKGLPDEIWFEEFASVERCCDMSTKLGLSWFNEDFENTADFFQYLHQRVLNQESTSELQPSQTLAWMNRVDARMSEEVVSEGGLQQHLQACLASVSDETGRTPSGHVIDPALLTKRQPSLPRKTAWLVQLGNQLAVTQHNAFAIPEERSSLMARLDYRVCSLKISGLPTPVALPERLSDALTPLPETQGLLFQKVRLQTDLTTLELQPLSRPQWAKRVGRDAYGLYAELEIPNLAKPREKKTKSLVQRFRWIPAGTFMMGSPESEPERFGDEELHSVTLTQGYWLAETAVTQAVWQSVMGENPSRFRDDPQNPVEQVSWDDSQQLISQLNQQYAEQFDGLVCRSPTEAEWEYACRAGTSTPFSFGENVTSKEINFDGNKTVSVKSLPPNAWGLYEMHGNVWEWCADRWQDNLGTKAMLDPCHDYDSAGADRVLRGGLSWARRGVRVRSAYRFDNSPGLRNGDFGLRLSLGHELKARSAKKA